MPETRISPMLVNFAAAAILVAGFFGSLFAFRHTLSCFVLSFVLAFLFDPFVVAFERRKVSRTWGIVVLYGFLAVFSVFFFAYIIPFVTLRWESFLRDIPVYIQKIKETMILLRSKVEPMYGAEEWEWAFGKITESLDTMLSKLGAGVYLTASKVIFNLISILLAPILVFFMLYYKREIIELIVYCLPVAHRDALVEVGRDINRSMGGFIRGQFIVSAIVAIFSSAALFLMGVDYPIFNGIFAGISSIIPFVGVILATLPPLFFAWVKFQSGAVILKVAAVFAVIYFLEGYLVKPLVFKESMDLNPLVTILMVMALGEVMGFWGILLAIPIAAALRIVGEHVRRGSFSSA